MAIGYGYGSEYHLMRFLGRHRDQLNKCIKEAIGLKNESDIHWLDFGFTKNGDDQELCGIAFLEGIVSTEKYNAIDELYHRYSINNIDRWQHWDAVFTLNDTVYLVEAKAHKPEFDSDEHITRESEPEILRFMHEQFSEEDANETMDEKRMGKYYQLANRLAFASFLNNNNVKTMVLYILFGNGYEKIKKEGRKSIFVGSESLDYDGFKILLEDEIEELNLNGDTLNIFEAVYIDAKTGNSCSYDNILRNV